MTTDITHLARRAKTDDRAFGLLTRECRKIIGAAVARGMAFGLEQGDAHTAALLGMWDAVQDFDATKASFYPFAKVCINHHLMTEIKAARRIKQQFITASVRFGDPGVPDLHCPCDTPESIVVRREFESAVAAFLRESLAEQERAVLSARLAGGSHNGTYGQYDHLKAAGMTYKQVDNALQRLRRKARVVLGERLSGV